MNKLAPAPNKENQTIALGQNWTKTKYNTPKQIAKGMQAWPILSATL